MKRLLNILGSATAKHQRKITYLFVGGLLFLIDLTVTLAMFYVFDVKAGYSSAIGFSSSFVVGFALNKNLVFKHTSTSRFKVHVQVTMYLLLSLVNLFVTSFTVNLLVNKGLRIELVKPGMVIMAACWNYLILGRYIFSQNKQEKVD